MRSDDLASEPDSGILSIWTVYDHPSDFPDVFVARQHRLLRDGGTVPDVHALTSKSLTSIRAAMERLGLVRLERMPDDDPVIIETWI